jgi:hypothetical protein
MSRSKLCDMASFEKEVWGISIKLYSNTFLFRTPPASAQYGTHNL